MAPIALGIDVPQVERILQSQFDLGHGSGDLNVLRRSPHERAFVVQEDPVARANMR